MASNPGKRRLEFYPSRLGDRVLEAGHVLFPDDGQSDLIERLMIAGLWMHKHMRHLEPPPMIGGNRHRWRLPSDIEAWLLDVGDPGARRSRR